MDSSTSVHNYLNGPMIITVLTPGADDYSKPFLTSRKRQSLYSVRSKHTRKGFLYVMTCAHSSDCFHDAKAQFTLCSEIAGSELTA